MGHSTEYWIYLVILVVCLIAMMNNLLRAAEQLKKMSGEAIHRAEVHTLMALVWAVLFAGFVLRASYLKL